MLSESVTTGLTTTRTGTDADASSAAATTSGMLGDGLDRLRPVERLAAGDEPDLVRAEVDAGRGCGVRGHCP